MQSHVNGGTAANGGNQMSPSQFHNNVTISKYSILL